MVDCDLQGSVGGWLRVNSENTFFDLLTDRIKLQDCIYQARKRLDIIPSDKKLALIEVRLAKQNDIKKTRTSSPSN